MPTQSIDVLFPAAGVGRRMAFSATPAEPPYFSPWAINVRLEDSLTNRMRGGYWAALAPAAVPADENRYLVDDSGNRIVTDAGDPIVAGTQESVASSGGRLSIEPGGYAPSAHTAEVVYRDRLIRPEGTTVLASRQGDYSDWNYHQHVDDPGRAFAIQLSEAGEVGAAATALIPHKDAFLLAATAGSLWVLAGDPTFDGEMRNISRDVGCVAARAWCKNHLDTVYFLSSHGLYAIGANGDGLSPVSENLVPEELTGVADSSTVLTYSHADRGVYIDIPSASVSWFFDTERGQFWPYDRSTTNSHLLCGPLKIADLDSVGVVNSIHGMLANGSADVEWRIVTGETAEEAAANGKAAISAAMSSISYSSYVKSSGTWSAGRSFTSQPRVRAMWVCLWLYSAGNWAFERVTIKLASAGSWRK